MYDYLVVGSGLYGAIFAHEAKAHGKSVLVVDKRPNIAGNIYTENIEGINVHKYGAHIFHTNNKKVWNYITQFAELNRFTNSPVANYKGELYSLPFNMYTFNKMWGVVTPEEASAKIEEQRKEITGEPQNLEEQAISLVGRDIYEKLIKGYTEKQWGRDCKELPSFIIKRLPVRLTFDNNYFNALYQGIPVGGYTKMIANLLDGIEVRLNTDYLANKEELDALADKVVYTGPIDAYFDYKLGTLEYRSVRFETETLDKPNFQGKLNIEWLDIPQDIIKSFLQKGEMGHFWYLGALIIVYMLLPWISQKSLEQKKLLLFSMGIVCFTVQTVSLVMTYPLQAGVIQTFRVWTWLLYFLLGSFIEEITSCLKKKLHFNAHLIMVIVVTGIVVAVHYFVGTRVILLGGKILKAEYFYDSILDIIWVILFFSLLLRVKICKRVKEFIRKFASLTLGIYIIHFPLRLIVVRILKVNSLTEAVCFWLIVLIISAGITWIIGKTKIGCYLTKI